MENKNQILDLTKEIEDFREAKELEKQSIINLFDQKMVDQVKKDMKDKYDSLGDADNQVYFSKNIESVPIANLVPSPKQSRLGYNGDSFYDEGMKEFLRSKELRQLAASIEKNGLLQPILIRQVKKRTSKGIDEDDGKKRYSERVVDMVIAGHRRVLAHIFLERTHINAIRIHDGDSDSENVNRRMAMQNATENLERARLNPMELSFMLADLSKDFTNKEIAGMLSFSKSLVARLIGLSENLTKDIQTDVMQHTGKINYSALYEISLLPKNKQAKAYALLKNKTRNASKLIRAMRNNDNKENIREISRIRTIPRFDNKTMLTLIGPYKEDFLPELNDFLLNFLQKRGHNVSFKEDQDSKQKTNTDSQAQNNSDDASNNLNSVEEKGDL